MLRLACSLAFCAALLPAADDQPTFKSEVSLSRIDTRVVDREGRPVIGLTARDFVLHIDGKDVPIKNFANESTPIDILLLLDVSGSMEPHVERIASAAQQALNVLSDRDRMAIMVFDTRTRVRLPFRSSHEEISSELHRIVRSEGFNGGTRITSAMLDAARYVRRQARPDARRAIVILTDDETQDAADEQQVEGSLQEAGAVLSFLQAPYEEPNVMSRRGGGGRPRGTWGSGGGIGFPGGGGLGWPGGRGGGMPGGGGGMGIDPSHSAGTETIARDTGGDTMPVSDAAALEDTLSRLRQRYALYFYMPEGTSERSGNVQVGLAEQASLRYHDAEIQSRRVFLAGGNDGQQRTEPAVVTKVNSLPPEPTTSSRTSSIDSSSTSTRRGRAVNEDSGPMVNSVGTEDSATSGTSTSTAAPAQNSGSQNSNSNTNSNTGTSSSTAGKGWPKAPKQNQLTDPTTH